MRYAPQQPEFQLEPLTGKDLYVTLQHKKKHTAPGQDSWRVRELLALPSSAWDQLASVLNESERRGVLPCAMTAVWMADLAKSEDPSPPLSIRPISITSVIYRAYVGTRTRQLQGFRHVYCTVGGPSWSKMVIQSQGGICLFCRVLRKALFTTSLRHSPHCRERS